jgi:hypothetical protein
MRSVLSGVVVSSAILHASCGADSEAPGTQAPASGGRAGSAGVAGAGGTPADSSVGSGGSSAGGAGGAAGTGGGSGAGAAAGAGGSSGADAAGGSAGASDGSAGGTNGGCNPVGPQPTSVVVLQPKLFGAGADPSADPECTEVLNPERGFFQFRDMRSLGSLSSVRQQGFTLIYGKILIDDYRSRDLDSALLNQLTSAFAAVRAAGLKVLPRFHYSDDATSPDAPLDRVLAHVQQLTPLLRANADVIVALKAGFVGAWGEWHSSTNNLTQASSRKAILDALLEALPAERTVLVRRPSFKRDAYAGPLTAATALAGTPIARVGHHNDCFLASANDMGTYQQAGERDYALADSAFVPVGGETCAVFPARSECAPAMVEMAQLHFGFLNISYHPDVIQSWRTGGCFGQIACRLGYRLALLRHESPQSLRAGETLSVALRLVNDGYSRPPNPRGVEIVLEGPVRRELSTSLDPRQWAPGPFDLCLSAPVPADLPSAEYRIGVRFPDGSPSLRGNPSYAVRLSNGITWDPATGTNRLDARVTVQP